MDLKKVLCDEFQKHIHTIAYEQDSSDMTDLSENNYPPRWRVLVAFALAPGIAAILMAMFQPAYDGLELSERIWRTAVTIAVFGAYPTALAIGVPAYLALRSRLARSWFNCALAGAAVAGVPWLLLALLIPNPDQASIGGRATVIDGTTTAFGWLMNFQFVGTIAIYGLVAGVLFWLIATGGRTASGSKR